MFRPCLDSKAGLVALCALTFLASGCSVIGARKAKAPPPPVAATAPVESTPPVVTAALPDETTPPSENAASSANAPVDAPAKETVAANEGAAPKDAAPKDKESKDNGVSKDNPAPKDDKKDEKKAKDEKKGKDGKKKGKDKDAQQPAVPVIPAQALQSFNDALAQLNAGGLSQAEQMFRALSIQYPQYSAPLLNLGIIYAKSERFDEAEKTLQEALRRNPANPVAFNELGIVYRRLGRFEDADAAYTQALRIDPNYALAHLNLGVLCDLYLQQPERALQAFERYLAIAPEPSPQVTSWVSELKTRLAASQRSAEVKKE